jgi:hypothetical protein
MDLIKKIFSILLKSIPIKLSTDVYKAVALSF